MLNVGTHNAGPRLLNGELSRKNHLDIKVRRKTKKLRVRAVMLERILLRTMGRSMLTLTLRPKTV